MIKHYIKFQYPGSFMSESKSKEIAERLFDGMWPDNAYSYQLFSREEVMIDGETFKGICKNFSPVTFRGKLITIDDVPDTDEFYILRNNMKFNTLRTVQTCNGQTYFMNETDVVIPC